MRWGFLSLVRLLTHILHLLSSAQTIAEIPLRLGNARLRKVTITSFKLQRRSDKGSSYHCSSFLRSVNLSHPMTSVSSQPSFRSQVPPSSDLTTEIESNSSREAYERYELLEDNGSPWSDVAWKESAQMGAKSGMSTKG